jgi:hypothetical protein
MKNNFLVILSAILLTAACLSPLNAFAADAAPYCEVIRAEGNAQLLRKGQEATPLKEGMALLKGDSFVLGAGASADLAFDPEWNNTARLIENTRMTLRSVSPVRINMTSGDVYAKLDKLPQGVSFEIKTPAAVATVRGTKFRTTHLNGQTTVFNDSETSLVYVYHLDENGNRSGRAIVLKPGELTTIDGEAEAYDSPQDELDEARDREDQDRLNDDLNRSRTEAPQGETIPDPPGNF